MSKSKALRQKINPIKVVLTIQQKHLKEHSSHAIIMIITYINGDNKKNLHQIMMKVSVYGSPTWARTRDTRINSPLLYQLSYWRISCHNNEFDKYYITIISYLVCVMWGVF